MTRHDCPGIRPQPLGSYLAGLGLVRLIGEQADPAATARWGDDGLVIDTVVSDLAEWLVSRYVPTPVLSPWNGGSGFGVKDKEPKRRLADLLASPSPRLSAFRDGVAAARDVMRRARADGWIKPDGKGGEKVADKARIVQEFRNRCPDVLLPWIDAAVVLTGDQPFFPPLLGTGGNDGRFDFSTNFHQRLIDVLDGTSRGRARSLAWARDLLDGAETERLDEGPVGQFDPAAAGGQASSPFGSADSLVNPWAYVLLTEGALLFASGTARRHQHAAGRAAMPFTVRFSPDGTDSGAAGEAKTSRGEVWAPVWDQPYTIAEIRQLFGEARANWRGRPAERAVDFYAATRTLGVARGLSGFVRYGLQQRNGLAFVAVPVATVDIRSKPEVRLAARVEDWALRLRGPDASSAVGAAVRRFDAAHLAYARDGGPRPLARLLAAVTDIEQAVGRSGRTKENVPVRRPPTAKEFLAELVKAECAELRVAVGIASCATLRGRGKPARTMRQILLPVDPPDAAQRNGRWRQAPVVAGFGLRPLRQVLADVLVWRSRTAADEGDGQLRFRGAPTFRHGVPVPAADLHAFARGLLDEAELDMWLRACLALDWSGSWGSGRVAWTRRPDSFVPVPTLGLLQPLAGGLALDGGSADAPALAMEPDWASRLAAGQLGLVHQEAVARLRQAGWQAVPIQPVPSPEPGVTGVHVCAALVPRCREPQAMLRHGLAVRLKEEVEELEPHIPELAEELS